MCIWVYSRGKIKNHPFLGILFTSIFIFISLYSHLYLGNSFFSEKNINKLMSMTHEREINRIYKYIKKKVKLSNSLFISSHPEIEIAKKDKNCKDLKPF